MLYRKLDVWSLCWYCFWKTGRVFLKRSGWKVCSSCRLQTWASAGAQGTALQWETTDAPFSCTAMLIVFWNLICSNTAYGWWKEWRTLVLTFCINIHNQQRRFTVVAHYRPSVVLPLPQFTAEKDRSEETLWYGLVGVWRHGVLPSSLCGYHSQVSMSAGANK